MTRKVLPSYLKPSHYNLTIYPDIYKHKFYGEVVIKIVSSGSIHLNAKELEILTVKVNGQSKTYTKDTENEAIIIEGEYFDENEVVISYTGIHNDKMNGFYRSSVELENSKTHMVVTQFEPTDCRKCMPCVDEPNKKATFQVSIICENHLTALSNTSVKDISDFAVPTDVKSLIHITEKPYKKVTFEKTPIMSTYILAMATGEFDYIESSSVPGNGLDAIPVRAYGPKNTKVGNIKEAKFALDVTCRALPEFAERFDMPYPIEKLDLLAVPDFSAGAMENFGLITFRTILMYITESSSLQHQQQCAYVNCHELAHQWFGNSVTFQWWQELWLNEGFATKAGWYITDILFPEWKIWDKFIANDYLNGMNLDSLLTTHPIDVPVDDPNDIGQIFDAISYSKGATVIKMLYDNYGDKFIKGVASYLKEFRWKNATSEDLWRNVSASCEFDISNLMRKWTTIAGYPFIVVDKNLKLRQQRFLMEGSQEETWPIPLGLQCFEVRKDGIYASEIKPLQYQLMEKVEHQLQLFPCTKLVAKIQLSEEFSCFKLNIKQSTMVRVQYHDITPLLKLVEVQLKNKLEILSAGDRLGILNDMYNLAQSGKSSVLQYLNALKYYKDEEDYYVLNDLAQSLQTILEIFTDSTVTAKVNSLRRDIFTSIAFDLGWDYNDDNHLKRTLAISQAGLANEKR
eukprot:NODE_79_length_23048_cov_0.747614.p3 type:complete len:685 gc:universal NODE_79_length_23048_cov_0.747614:8639-10693(+)